VANGLLSPGLAAVGVLAAGTLLRMTTPIHLLELARPDHPLLRQLQLLAPGTYQHSIVLSNLAEAAASAVGADVLEVRVGAYYHDIGKSIRPYFFIENQLGGTNPHDGLDPRTSAEILIEHVVAGAALGQRHRLPDSVIDFILEHHGTTRVEYFYCRAVQQLGLAQVDEAAFHYPGPRPRSPETAIVMLADAAEAAVRAAGPSSREEIDEIVAEAIGRRLAEAQLDDSRLTLHDVVRIRRAFVDVLRSMYHPRIKYPAGVTPATATATPAAPAAPPTARRASRKSDRPSRPARMRDLGPG
jgi:putative nucleotidyltransferase with HDIG domain